MRSASRILIDSSHALVKTVAALMVLTLALPLTLIATAAARLIHRTSPLPRPGRRRTVMISGGKMTKALHLARAFHRAGHRVILTETHAYRITGHRFSNAVDRFHITPDPRSPGYVDALRAIITAEEVDVYIPVSSPVSSVPDAQVRTALSDLCEVVHGDPDLIGRLDDKTTFSSLAETLALSVPAFRRITHRDQVKAFDFASDGRTFILKSVAYDPVRRLDLTRLPLATPAQTAAFVDTLPITEANPWILQEYIEGTEYCTHSTVRRGRVTLHACCRSSASQLNYEMVQKPAIADWVGRMVGALDLTGQASFDFIETAEGRLFAIECNPRTHSAITMFYDHPGVARSYLDDEAPRIDPLPQSRPTYWLFHELFEGLTRPSSIAERFKTIRRGKEAIFDSADPLPFLMVHHVHLPVLLLRSLRDRQSWVKIDFNIGKLVAPAGD